MKIPKDHDIVALAERRKNVIVKATHMNKNAIKQESNIVMRKRKAVIVRKAIMNASLMKFGSVVLVFQVFR